MLQPLHGTEWGKNMRQNVRNDNWSESVISVPPLYSAYDAAANDSDKTFTVPNNEMWKLNFLHVILVTTATVGNRIITLEIDDADGNNLIDLYAGAVQAASLTRHYDFIQGIYRETSFVNGELHVPIPQDCYLGPGYTLRVYDSAAIAAAADDMTVSFQAMKFQV